MIDDARRPTVVLKPEPQTATGSSRRERWRRCTGLRRSSTWRTTTGPDGARRGAAARPSRSSASRTCRPSGCAARRSLRAVSTSRATSSPTSTTTACFDRGVHVLGCGPAYAQAVAEYALGLALDVARGISREDRAFRAGAERYVADGNADADPAARRRGRPDRVRQPRARPAPAAGAVRRRRSGCTTRGCRTPALLEQGVVPATLDEVLRGEPVRVRAGHGDRRERAPARGRRAGPAAATGPG